MYLTIVFLDEYYPATAELEIVFSEVTKAIQGNPRLLAHFTSGMELHMRCSVVEMTTFARDFLKNIERERQWADKNLWWM